MTLDFEIVQPGGVTHPDGLAQYGSAEPGRGPAMRVPARPRALTRIRFGVRRNRTNPSQRFWTLRRHRSRAGAVEELADLCRPETLAALKIAPDRIASRSRPTTKPIAASLWERGFSGLRWWSRYWGDWHSTIVFTCRAFSQMTFGNPEPLRLDSLALLEVACSRSKSNRPAATSGRRGRRS